MVCVIRSRKRQAGGQNSRFDHVILIKIECKHVGKLGQNWPKRIRNNWKAATNEGDIEGRVQCGGGQGNLTHKKIMPFIRDVPLKMQIHFTRASNNLNCFKTYLKSFWVQTQLEKMCSSSLWTPIHSGTLGLLYHILQSHSLSPPLKPKKKNEFSFI